jgi:16S rRNA (adenine1518-N6/adenine1519-N6)-dimethyltransferase
MKKKRSGNGARLGQHFLTGQWAAQKLAAATDVHRDETILEIGPGKGALTRELLATSARVVAVEKDEVLVEHLKEIFGEEIKTGNLVVVSDDIRNVTPGKLGLREYVLAANIPYYITGEIIRQFLTAEMQPRAMALLVQKEVADRIIARDGKESILSLSVKAYGMPRVVAKVSRGNFSPPPSVDSAILLIDGISKNFFADCDEKSFFEVVRAGFSSKRKFLVSNLGVRFGKDLAQATFLSIGINEKMRAEDLGLEQWKLLAQQMSQRTQRTE